MDAAEFVSRSGAEIVEGYSVDTEGQYYPPVFDHTDFVSTFRRLGFEECLRRSETRPRMRLNITKT